MGKLEAQLGKLHFDIYRVEVAAGGRLVIFWSAFRPNSILCRVATYKEGRAATKWEVPNSL